MESEFIFKTIKELSQSNSKRSELREYCKLKSEQVLKLLPRRILNSDGANILNCILDGYAENKTNSNKVKVVDIILKSMRTEITSITHSGDVISRICLELPKFSVEDLVRWCDDSIQSIVEDGDVNMIWRDIIPECLNLLSNQDQIKHCGTEMSGVEYKVQCVHALCQCRWQERHLVQLAAMFKDMQLARHDHRQVVNKICSYIIDVHPDTLPPLVHQLLKLCKEYNVEVVLSHVSHYFNARVYNKLEPPPQDSESTTMDVDDIVQHSPAELSRCLSTCVYHMSAGAEPDRTRRQLRLWPRTQLLRAPLLVDLALALADRGADLRAACLETVKLAIELREMDEVRRDESAWVRSLLPPDVDVATVLKVLTTESANHRQLTVVGLIGLAFTLLSVPHSRPVARACWSHGELILARLLRSQPETAPHALAQLADRLVGVHHYQHVDCLYVLCKLTPVAVERCPQLTCILESCRPGVFRAVRPLIAFSTRVRDTIVMVCRKGLYSRDSEHRQLALWGFLTVLRHVRLSRTGSSQLEQPEAHTANSYLTQVAVDLHASQQGTMMTSRVRNETMCLEVVAILRRCLIQDSAVRALLYTELYGCIREKQTLHESVLELLLEHLDKYLPDYEAPPLLWDKCVQVTPTNAVLIEPIGRLLYAVAQFLQPAAPEESDDMFSSQQDSGGAYTRRRLLSAMDKLCKSTLYATAELEDLGLTDLTPESKAKALRVQQVLQCYEALIAHQLLQWTPESTNANTLYRLFKDCKQLLENTKISKNSKKGKSLNDTKNTTKSQKSQKSQPEKGKAATKVSSMVKDRAGPFKALPCLWDLRVCLRLLQLLYSEEVSWSSIEQRNIVRSHSPLHVWTLRCVQASVRAASEREHAADVLGIAALLHERCLCRFQGVCEFDESTALGALELYRTCLDALLAPDRKLKLEKVFTHISGLTEASASASVAAILEAVHTALRQLDAEEGGERDAAGRKLVGALLQVAAVLLEAPVHACDQLHVVMVKLEEYVRSSKQECIPLVPPLLTAAFREHREVQFLDELLQKLTSALGLIDEDETSAEEDSRDFPSIDVRSGHVVLAHICTHLRVRARALDHLLARARDLDAALSSATQQQHQRIDNELKELYEGIIIQLCQLSRCVSAAARLRWSGAGASGEGPPGVCVRLYALLAALARQLPPRLALALRLERLLKVCGRRLSAVCDALITYAEAAGGRSTRLVPRLVLEAENFSRHVLLLEKKAKLNYQQYLSLGTARDFRIKAPVLQEMLGAIEPEERDEDDENITDAETVILSPDSERDSDDEGASKRRKIH